MRTNPLKALSLACLMVVLGSVLSHVRADSVIYSQPSNFPVGTVFSSQNDVGGFGNFATVYDNFTLRNTATVTDMHWQGGYFNPGVPGHITAFTITFLSDSTGQPGSALLAQSIPGNANETFVGNSFFGPVFNYFVDLTTPFLATGGTPYWLSIVPDLTPFQPQWGWHTGTGGDGVGFQDFFGVRTLVASDLTFDATGSTAVPEPASLSLLSLGILGLVAYRSRCRRQIV